jgi:hypothetical protein
MKKLKTPEINISLKADWQKSLTLALFISVLIFGVAIIYLILKPIDKSISTIIDEEISSTNIIFNQKTIDLLGERRVPEEIQVSSAGKNPFAPF